MLESTSAKESRDNEIHNLFSYNFYVSRMYCTPVQELSDVPASNDHIEPITPEWDKYIELDSIDSGASESAEDNNASLMDAILEDNIGYHFRKIRWGFSQERVELSEVGNTVLKRTPQATVYRCKINGVNCELVYTFDDNNKLRTAGYITTEPVPHAIISERQPSRNMDHRTDRKLTRMALRK